MGNWFPQLQAVTATAAIILLNYFYFVPYLEWVDGLTEPHDLEECRGNSLVRDAFKINIYHAVPTQKFVLSICGGGLRDKILIPNGVPFAGGTIGGGKREDIYKTYQKETKDEQPYFPFVAWPVYSTVGLPFVAEDATAERPGGEMVYAQAIEEYATSREPQKLFLVGDKTSLAAILYFLPTSCSAAIKPAHIFDQNSTSYVPLNNVLQFYRGNSFVLGSYPPQPSDNHLGADDQDFLRCVNTTIGRYLPIPVQSESSWFLSILVSCLFFGAFIAWVVGCAMAWWIIVTLSQILLLRAIIYMGDIFEWVRGCRIRDIFPPRPQRSEEYEELTPMDQDH